MRNQNVIVALQFHINVYGMARIQYLFVARSVVLGASPFHHTSENGRLEMFIWRSIVQVRELSEGEFFCPTCNHRRKYVRKQASRYLVVLYFPIIEQQKISEFLKCRGCKRHFDPGVLEPRKQSMFRLVDATRQELLNGISPLEAKARLIGKGLEPDIANTLIHMAQK